MKILFLCGCLEPGKDGVGDYSRQLGIILSQMNHEVMLMSLYDSYILPQAIDSKENFPGRIFRISAKKSRNTRYSVAWHNVENFAPDWISLQYVPYSFHFRGMDLWLPYFFSKFKGKYQWHLMIHEPWVKTDKNFSSKRFVGLVQKYLLSFLVRRIRPAVTHTSNPYYRDILLKEGIRSEVLHLPGNISKTRERIDLLKEEFGKKLGITKISRKQWLLLGTFGKLRPTVSYKSLLEKILESPDAEGKKLVFLSVGNAGPFADEIFSEIRTELKGKVLLHRFGNREVAEISAFFQWLDFGIASVPQHLLGKSGAYAAMRNHGLKILVPDFRKPNEQNAWRENSCGYLLNIPDEDFSSEKVARKLVFALESRSQRNIDQEGFHENIIYNS